MTDDARVSCAHHKRRDSHGVCQREHIGRAIVVAPNVMRALAFAIGELRQALRHTKLKRGEFIIQARLLGTSIELTLTQGCVAPPKREQKRGQRHTERQHTAGSQASRLR